MPKSLLKVYLYLLPNLICHYILGKGFNVEVEVKKKQKSYFDLIIVLDHR